jgi:hypothetical protein
LKRVPNIFEKLNKSLLSFNEKNPLSWGIVEGTWDRRGGEGERGGKM